MAGPRLGPRSIGGDTTTTTTTTEDGTTTTTTKKTWEIETADVALIGATLLLAIFLGLAIGIDSWRNAVAESLVPGLIGVLTCAVGGTAAYKIFLKNK